MYSIIGIFFSFGALLERVVGEGPQRAQATAPAVAEALRAELLATGRPQKERTSC